MTASPVEVRGAIEESVELFTLQAPLRVEADEEERSSGIVDAAADQWFV